MGAEKHSLKGGGVGGFLHLFDWNGKSRKKLTYNKLDFSEGTKQGKRSDENLPRTRFNLMEYENGGISSVKGSSDYSCASSTTDEEGHGIRAPGVVARLMGLDSLPLSSVTEPYSTPVFKLQSLQDSHYLRKTSEYYNDYQNNISENQSNRVDSFRRRAAESRPQKVPNTSPIERFQCETLPPRSAKPYPITHHKLLSPIKSPGFISPKNVAVIMEAAAKILEPRYQTSSRRKSFGSSSIAMPIQVHDSKEHTATSQKSTRPPETSKRPVESSAFKYLKGQSLNKSWNGSDDTTSYRDSTNSEENHSVGSKNKGKSISLAVQAKVNVQRREGLSSSSTKSLLLHKDEDEYKTNLSLKNKPTASRSTQNNLSISKSSGVLKQNNQKQNCPAKRDKLSLKPSVSNQQGRKHVSGDGSFGRNKASNKPTVSSRVSRKGSSAMSDLAKEVPLQTRGHPRKKRALNEDFYSENSGFVDSFFMDSEKSVQQPHVAINEQHVNRTEDGRKKGMDVVSFTFTSPMIKPTTISRFPNRMVEKENTENICSVNNCETATDPRGKRSSLTGLKVIGGDALSILLEQKLRELTSGMETSCVNSGKREMATIAPSMQDSASAFTAVGAFPWEDQKRHLGLQKDKLVGGFTSGCSSKNDQVLNANHKFQAVKERAYCSSISDAGKELDFNHPSPVSIFEASFSSETCFEASFSSETCCNSSESSESTNGNKMFHSFQAQNIASGETCQKKMLSVEAETELSDSASTVEGTSDREHVAVRLRVSDQMRIDKQELEYVREMLCNIKLIFKDLPLGHAHRLVDPALFDRLENQKIEWRNEAYGNDHKVRQQELFDCVREFLDMKCGRYNRGGYKAWAKGVALVQKQGLAEDICKEILLWRSMGDWMVDDLVEWDMSNHLGRWLDFEAEAFQLGEEIQRDILSSLVDEVVAELL